MSDEESDEAVESSGGSPETDAENASSMDEEFDLEASTSHAYLGTDMEVLRGRTLLDERVCYNIPLVYEKCVVLFPGQTLPIIDARGNLENTLHTAIRADKVIGVVRFGLKKDAFIGTTAEIYEYSDSGPGGFRVKTIGRQRFKIIKVYNEPGLVSADVRILPEIDLEPPFFDERIASLNHLRMIPKNETEAEQQEYKVLRRDSIVTPWPSWVYRQYDPRRLAMRIRSCLKIVESKGTIIPEDPVDLSYWVAHNLILNDISKIALLKHDSAIPRLQYEVKVLSMLGRKAFLCSSCRSFIARQSDVIPMNKEGLQVAYCNPSGSVHETVTLQRAKNVVLNPEEPSTECSWFPGYAWTIANCKNCACHIGWHFTAVNINLEPSQFWGLTRKSLVLRRRFKLPESDEEEAGSPSGDSEARHIPDEDSSEDSEADNDHIRFRYMRPR